MKTFSFIEFINGEALKDVDRILIPKIQRDYAQGRKSNRATDVRNLFIASLLATLRAKDGSIQNLDFIYGYKRDGNFEPLDGQQRLTTLFLLHWLVLPVEERRKVLVKKDNQQPSVSYCTRPSARDFCKFLVDIDIDSLGERFDSAVHTADLNNEDRPKLSNYIRELDEYRHNWNFDSTVKAMLCMLDSLMTQLETFQKIRNLDYNNLNNIRFHFRNLEDLEQGDELYVKMNARGLELSDFDNTKSSLEGDMLSANVEEKCQDSWRSGIDGNWIDCFWHRAKADDANKDLGLKEIHKIEDDLKTFLLRLITLRWFEKFHDKVSNGFEKEILDMTEQNRSKRTELSANLNKYLELRFKDTHSETPGLCPVIDYSEIVNDMNSFIYKDGSVCLAADSLLPPTKVTRNNDKKVGFLDSFVSEEFTNVNRLIMYGMLSFTRMYSAAEISESKDLQDDWITWVRVIRNLCLARNSNTPFDAPSEIKKAMVGIKNFINGFDAEKKSKPHVTMSEYIRNTPVINGFDDDIYQEERYKEQLRLDDKWVSDLDLYESEGYLFGQLRAPLQWAGDDVELFAKYAKIINRFMTEQYMGTLLYVGLLLISDYEADMYPFGDSLLIFGNDRDRSFKRYLREQVGNKYAPALKKLADTWMYDFPKQQSVQEFLEAMIAKYRNDARIPLWKRQLADFPEIINERSHQRRIHVSENTYLLESKQYIKRWNINLCWLKKTRYKDNYFIIHNTKEEGEFNDSISGGKLILARGTDSDLSKDINYSAHNRFQKKGLKRMKLNRKKIKRHY